MSFAQLHKGKQSWKAEKINTVERALAAEAGASLAHHFLLTITME
jgi:hypothetical protein